MVASKLKSIVSYRTHRLTDVVGNLGGGPWHYLERIEVTDRAAYEAEIATLGKELIDELYEKYLDKSKTRSIWTVLVDPDRHSPSRQGRAGDRLVVRGGRQHRAAPSRARARRSPCIAGPPRAMPTRWWPPSHAKVASQPPSVADLAEDDASRALVAAVEAALGPVSVLVNNAGPFADAPFRTLDPAVWDRIMAVNLRAPYLLAQQVVPGMERLGWGRIVNIGATSSLVRSHSVYGLAKAALVHLTESLALELAPNITVNAVVPSQIASARTDTMPVYKEAAIAGTPLGRLVREDEIARDGRAALLAGLRFRDRAIDRHGRRAFAAAVPAHRPIALTATSSRPQPGRRAKPRRSVPTG